MKLIAFLVIFMISVVSHAKDKVYQINDMCIISVADILELRNQDDAYTHFLNDTLKYFSPANAIFQQNGLSVRSKEALKHYCRIMIMTDNEGNGEYPSCNSADFTFDDLQSLKETAKQELYADQIFLQGPIATIEKTSRGINYVKISYTRTGVAGKGDVCVRICYFFNYNQALKLVYSYRKSEKNIWLDALERTIESFEWKTPFYCDIYNDSLPIKEPSYNYNNSFYWGIICGCLFMVIVFFCGYITYQHKKKEKTKFIQNKLHTVHTLVEQDKTQLAKNILQEETSLLISEDDNSIKTTYDESKAIITTKEVKIEEEISSLLTDLSKSTTEGNIEKALDLKNEAGKRIETEIPDNVKEKAKITIKKFNDEYVEGIIPNQQLCRVLYSIPTSFEILKGFYLKLALPEINSIVFPYRRKKNELRGYTESSFEIALRSAIKDMSNYKVLGDVSILPADGCHPYEPDIAIVEKTEKIGLKIDIEIDEPYSGYNRNPIHYIGYGDEHRDVSLANLGWITIRFSEKQIFKETSKCISYIRYLISTLDPSIEQLDCEKPSADKQWTFVEAQIMATRNYRENMLGHWFGFRETSDNLSTKDVIQTKFEKEAAMYVKPLMFHPKKNTNIDKSTLSFNQDNVISFEPAEHVYVYNGILELQSVSNVISSFFTPFDTLGLSYNVAQREGRNQCEVIEEWDSQGKESRDVGTFMHAQIENYLNKKEVCELLNFTYTGEYVNIDKEVSIATEIQYFKEFLYENEIVPFRTEWHIYDLKSKIAGTIDLLCRNGSSFDIYDWKRSHKASPNAKVWKYGLGVLSNIPDINFYHYALQQNLYKYILEKNYDIRVKNMYIVVLCKDYESYQKYQIPDMSSEIKSIINFIN